MEKNELLIQKKMALINEIVQAATAFSKNLPLAFPPKRIFRKKDRRPLKRLIKSRAMAAIGMAPQVTKMRIALIMSQPVPRFPVGGQRVAGMAVVGEKAPEVIARNGIVYNIPDRNGDIYLPNVSKIFPHDQCK